MTHSFYLSSFIGVGSCLLLAALALLLSRLQRKELPLSQSTETRLLQVSSGEIMPPDYSPIRLQALPIRDQLSLYSNSRLHLVRAHRLCLDDSSGELQAWMQRAEETHSRLIQALAMSICETVLGRMLRPTGNLYSNTALWLYLDEEWILTEMMYRRIEILESARGL